MGEREPADEGGRASGETDLLRSAPAVASTRPVDDTPPSRSAETVATPNGSLTSPTDTPRDGPSLPSISIPSTPDGLAVALSHLSAGAPTTGPARSRPDHRVHPPLVELGDDVDVPRAVAEATPETGLTLRVPARFEHLFVAAPLAYYLCAEVVAEPRSRPVLEAPSAGVDHRFDARSSFEGGSADLLRRVFHLDCLVREGDGPMAGADLLSDLGLDPRAVRRASPPERLARYLELPADRVRSALPDWHLSTYVAPHAGNVPSLPFLLDDLSLVYRPRASDLDARERVRRSLDDFYRRSRPVRSVDLVDPALRESRVHGWLADGTPIDAFKATSGAYEHRLRYRECDRDRLDVAVVLNDGEMDGERSEVAEIYRRRAADLPMSVTVHESLRRAELADLFAAPTDFVHYIGHCDVDGLRCPDGALSAASLETARARTFFLNGCGSYHEGLALVERGCVAGAVTLREVLNEQATTVGTAFARLLVHGFSIERAMQLARRRIMMGKDYAVVGDGTYALESCLDRLPAVVWLDRRDGAFDLTYEVHADEPGAGHGLPLDAVDRTHLDGSSVTVTVDRSELLSVLDRTAVPVVDEGTFRWSDELAARLRGR